MGFENIYYFHVHYGYELDTWEEKDEYGFVPANSFEAALEQLKTYYGNDMLSVTLEYIGDTGVLSLGNKDLAKKFRQEFIKYHYGSEEE